MTVGAGLRTVGPGSVPLSAGHRTGRGARGGTAGGGERVLGVRGVPRQGRGEARLREGEVAAGGERSPRAVSDLGRGISRAAGKETAVLLAGALGLAGPVAELFVAAARGRGPVQEV